MNIFFKTTTLLLLTTLFFQSCDSNNVEGLPEDTIFEEQKITTELNKKIITYIDFTRDIDIINPECAPTTMGISSSLLSFYFLNPQGDFYSSNMPMTDWESRYLEKKELAYNETGVRFTDNDFFIGTLFLEDVTFLFKRENIIKYFENCESLGYSDVSIPDPDFSVTASEIDFDCSGEAFFWVDNYRLFSGEHKDLSEALIDLDAELTALNTELETSYTFENVKISSLAYTSADGKTGHIIKREDMLNYFENCSFKRDINNNDCLNFIYPLEINHTNSGIEEVITINNDEDLTATFNTTEELAFVFPINLLGQDGSTLIIETNEELENAIDTSATYCE